MLKFNITLAVVLALSIVGNYGCKKKTTERAFISTRDSLYIFVMAGQSNMAGRGIIEPQDTITNPRVYVIDSAGKLVIAREPLHWYQPGFSGLDCGMSFATTLLADIPEGAKICLVPCAIGSTSIQDWLGDTSHWVKLYSNMMSRTMTAMQYGVLKGVLWHQGEANAESMDRAMNYTNDLQSFIRKIRLDVQLPELPFYAATLAPFCVRPFKDSINKHLYYTATALSGVFVVPTDGLSYKSDSVHFDAPGQRGLGQRFAAVVRMHLR